MKETYSRSASAQQSPRREQLTRKERKQPAVAGNQDAYTCTAKPQPVDLHLNVRTRNLTTNLYYNTGARTNPAISLQSAAVEHQQQQQSSTTAENTCAFSCNQLSQLLACL
jgi:predicted secreted protein